MKTALFMIAMKGFDRHESNFNVSLEVNLNISDTATDGNSSVGTRILCLWHILLIYQVRKNAVFSWTQQGLANKRTVVTMKYDKQADHRDNTTYPNIQYKRWREKYLFLSVYYICLSIFVCFMYLIIRNEAHVSITLKALASSWCLIDILHNAKWIVRRSLDLRKTWP